MIGKLFKVQPVVMLDGLFGGATNETKIGQKIIEDLVHGDQRNPLDAASQGGSCVVRTEPYGTLSHHGFGRDAVSSRRRG